MLRVALFGCLLMMVARGVGLHRLGLLWCMAPLWAPAAAFVVAAACEELWDGAKRFGRKAIEAFERVE